MVQGPCRLCLKRLGPNRPEDRRSLRRVDVVPQGHKAGLSNVAQIAGSRRYGEIIVRTISKGRWIEEALVDMPGAPALDNLPTPAPYTITMSVLTELRDH